MYEFDFGHIVLYPLGVFALSAVFFGWGYRVGRRKERDRVLAVAASSGGR
ncbi:MAG: hypothetical protein ACOYXR_03995 [Nitrospirota bacterium]